MWADYWWDDNDRARRVLHAALADGAEQGTGERAVSTATDDQQARANCCVEKYLSRVSLEYARKDGDRLLLQVGDDIVERPIQHFAHGCGDALTVVYGPHKLAAMSGAYIAAVAAWEYPTTDGLVSVSDWNPGTDADKLLTETIDLPSPRHSRRSDTATLAL